VSSHFTWFGKLLILNVGMKLQLRVDGVSGAIHKKYNTFQEAIMIYTRNYNRGRIRAVPVPGGPFWPVNPANPSPSISSTSSNSDDLWGELEDLSEEFSRVVFH
jgi:hypothetical protein